MRSHSVASIVASLLFVSIPRVLPAAVKYWDPDGATPGTSVSGNWDTVSANWTPITDSGANDFWAYGNDAVFGIASDYTVTLTEPNTVGNITVSGSAGSLTIAGTSVNSLTLAAPCSLNTGGRNMIITAPMNGGFGVTRSGAGTVTLSGVGTYSGGTLLTAGALALGADSVFSGGVVTAGPVGTGPITFSTMATTISASGGDRVLDNPIVLSTNVTIGGTTALTFRNSSWMLNGGNRTVTVNNTADTTIGSNLTDDGVARSLTKAGAGRLVLAGTNSAFLGNITVNAGGTLAIGNAAALRMLQASSILTANGVLDLNGFDGLVVGLAGSGSVTLGSRTLTIASAGASRNFTGVISGTGGLIVSNVISHQLEGQNTFSGGILIKAGTLFLRTNAAVGSSITRAAGTGTITMEGTDPVVANVTAALGGNLATGLVQITNRVVVSSGRVLLFPSNGGSVEYDSIISGPGGIQRDNNGSGPVIIAGNNTYSGGLRIEARVVGLGHKNAAGTGELVLGNPSSPPANTIILVPVVNLSGPNAITNITTVSQPIVVFATNGLELSGPMTLSNAAAITSLGDSLVKFSGNISGPAGISKYGTNSLVVSGANAYEGATIIAGGALLVNNTSGSGTGTNSVLVTTDGALGGNGSISGAVTVSSGATISPGSSIGRLAINNTLALQSGSTTIMELDKQSGTNDSIVGLSSVTYGGTLVVTNLAGTLAAGNSFKLFDSASYGGTFDSIVLPPLSGSLSWNTQNLAVNGTIKVAGGPSMDSVTVSGSSIAISGSGGYPFAYYYVLVSTSVLVPVSSWIPIATNQFDSNGKFSFSETISPGIPRRFYALHSP